MYYQRDILFPKKYIAFVTRIRECNQLLAGQTENPVHLSRRASEVFNLCPLCALSWAQMYFLSFLLENTTKGKATILLRGVSEL